MPTEDRRVGKLLPSPVNPSDTVCFTIEMPNAVQYRAAFLGQINQLGVWGTWDHARGDTECADCEEAAQLWRNAIFNATWSDECGGDMSCEDVADCIETNPITQGAIASALESNSAIQQALADLIASNGGIADNITNVYRYGTPISDGYAASPIVPLVNCDSDKLFGVITEIVDQLDQNNRDFLELVEVGTNKRERISNIIAAIPVIETLPFEDIISFIDKMEAEITENYEAQWTTSLKDEYRCGIFCKAQDVEDCILSFDLLVEFFEERIGASLEPANFFESAFLYFLTGVWTGTTVVDIMMLVQLGAWKQTSSFLGVTLRTLQSVGFLGANNPDPDWEILCEDCTPEFPFDIVMFKALGNRPSGTWEAIGPRKARFTAQRDTAYDIYYRVTFQFGETGGCYRFEDVVLSAGTTLISSGAYQCGANPKTNGYASNVVPGVPVEGQCYGGLIYNATTPFTVEIEFRNDCP